MKPKITVIGVGRLGLSFALLLNSKGYDVMGCDVNEKYIESLKDKSFVSKEPGVNDLLEYSTMRFTADTKEAFDHSDIIFVFVATPSRPGGDYDHNQIDRVVSKIEKSGVRNKTLVIGCTVMPYYCEVIERKLAHLDISVVYNPEFIAQGDIINGLEKADIVLIGGDNIPQELFDVYKNIMLKEPNFKVLSLTGAEITKISINCFLTLKICYANFIGEIVINSGEQENIDSILDAIGSDSRIGKKFLGYGFPAGGVCLPRDQKALNHHANFVGVHTKFTHAIDIENNRHSTYLLEYYIKQNPDKNVPFLFSYLGYKKGVDILTESYQLKLCIGLLRGGYKVDVPIWVKDIEVSDEFIRYYHEGKITFGQNPEGYKIN